MHNFSPASERNKQPIADKLSPVLAQDTVVDVLEVGSGSGQHALHLTAAVPGLVWQCSEHPDNLLALQQNLHGAELPSPVALDVMESWPEISVDMLYSANTLHIMGWTGVEALFAGAGRVVRSGGWLAVYGPFCYGQSFTAVSNAAFDQMLRQRDPQSGIRDFEAVNQLAEQAGFTLRQDHAMPANNQLLLWQKA